MGWKASMLIVQNTSGIKTAEEIIQKIDNNYYKLAGEVTLEQGINPRDESIYIGFYNDNIVLTLDAEYILMSIIDGGGGIENRLNELCPNGEIMGIFCQSTTNMHGYFLNKNGDRVRHKMISFEGPRMESGERFEEEIEIYKKAKKEENGVEYWSYGEDDSDRYEENQLMEDFTFGVAKRLLGVQLDHTEGEDLMFQVKFKKFIRAEKPTPATEKEVKKPSEKPARSNTSNTTYQRPERTTERKKRTTPPPTEHNSSNNFEPPNSQAAPKPTSPKTTLPNLKNITGLNISWATIGMFVAGLYLLYKLLN